MVQVRLRVCCVLVLAWHAAASIAWLAAEPGWHGMAWHCMPALRAGPCMRLSHAALACTFCLPSVSSDAAATAWSHMVLKQADAAQVPHFAGMACAAAAQGVMYAQP